MTENRDSLTTDDNEEDIPAGEATPEYRAAVVRIMREVAEASQPTTAGPVPTAEQAETWGADYLRIWCQGHPKEAAAEIERLRGALDGIYRALRAHGWHLAVASDDPAGADAQEAYDKVAEALGRD